MSSQRQQQRGPSWLEDYVGVDERLAKFRAAHPKARIVTQLLERETLTFRAEVYLEDNDSNIPNAVGHADVEGGSGNRKQSPVEKTETAAIGRALDVMGVEGRSEREEVQRAERQTLRAPVPDRLLDKEIMAALEVLDFTEEQLNKKVAKEYGHNRDWTELTPAVKREVLARLNNLANEKVA